MLEVAKVHAPVSGTPENEANTLVQFAGSPNTVMDAVALAASKDAVAAYAPCTFLGRHVPRSNGEKYD
jgi:hypothetical protein